MLKLTAEIPAVYNAGDLYHGPREIVIRMGTLEAERLVRVLESANHMDIAQDLLEMFDFLELKAELLNGTQPGKCERCEKDYMLSDLVIVNREDNLPEKWTDNFVCWPCYNELENEVA